MDTGTFNRELVFCLHTIEADENSTHTRNVSCPHTSRPKLRRDPYMRGMWSVCIPAVPDRGGMLSAERCGLVACLHTSRPMSRADPYMREILADPIPVYPG